MTQTYTPLPEGATPIIGTQGPSVLALQNQLNTTNAGAAGYTPLVPDGKYGPLTAAAANFKPVTAPVAPPTPNIGQVYASINNNLPGQDIIDAENKVNTIHSNNANGTSNVDEAAIRAQTLAQFQAEVDATNALYASKLRDAQVAGTGRLGSSTAIQARRGLLGSDFGAAETDTVNNGNNQIYAGIDAEKAAALSAINNKINETATKAIADRNTAIEGGAVTHLQDLKNSVTNKANTASQIAQTLYNNKLDPNTLPLNDLTTAITPKNGQPIPYGLTLDDIKNAYIAVKKTGDEAAAAKAASDAKAAKEGLTTIPEGSIVVDPTGKVISRGVPKNVTVGTNQEVYQKQADGTYKKVVTGPAKAAGAPKAKGNYTSATIPKDVSTSLQTTLKNHPEKSLSEFYAAFPEVSTSYLSSLYKSFNP